MSKKTMKIIFNENLYQDSLPCGYYIQGRPKTHAMKFRLHKKHCTTCKNHEKKLVSHKDFKEQPRFKSSRVLLGKNVRGIDRLNNSYPANQLEVFIGNKFYKCEAVQRL